MNDSRTVSDELIGTPNEKGEQRLVRIRVAYAAFRGPGRGYYVHVEPITLAKGYESYSLFSGRRILLETARRFSQARFDALYDAVKASTLKADEIKLARGGILAPAVAGYHA